MTTSSIAYQSRQCKRACFSSLRAYQNVMTFRLKVDTDMKRLISALESVMRAEPILRTRFAHIETTDNNEPFFQYVLKQTSSILPPQDSNLLKVVSRFRSAAYNENFSNWMAQVALVRWQDTSFFVLGMPHALYDAWSLHLLHQRVFQAYRSPNSEEAGSTIDQWQTHLEQVQRESRSSLAHCFWNERLRDLRTTTFQPSHATDDRCESLLLQRQSDTNVSDILQFCRSQGVTLQSVGLACWTLALAHQTRQLDVSFGVVLSGRTTEDSERLLFPTFSTVIFRPNVSEDCTRSEAVKQVHNAIIQVSEYQHYPLRQALQIVRKQGVETDPFNTLFTFQKLPGASDDLPALYDEVLPDEVSTKPPYAVNIELQEGAEGLVWTAAFQESIATKELGRTLLTQLDHILAALMAHPSEPLLQAHGKLVSICGLSRIERDDKRSTLMNKSKSEDHGNENEADIWTTTELTVQRVLAQVAKIDKEDIKKNTGVFHLGLDSISAIKVASELKKNGISLPVSSIIREHTIGKIAALAERLKSQSRSHGGKTNSTAPYNSAGRAFNTRIAIPEADVEMVIPATAGQCYMLHMWSASNGRLFYPVFWLKVSNCSIEAFENALKGLVRAAPMLRTLFVHGEEKGIRQTWQVVLKDAARDKYKLPWSVQTKYQADGLLTTIRIHHALYDAVSLELLMGELEKLCAREEYQVRSNINMNEFILRTTPLSATSQQFWTQYLHHNQDTLPPIGCGSFAATRVETFNPKLVPVKNLMRRLRRHGLTIQALFFAVYARLYAKINRNSEPMQDEKRHKANCVTIGIYLANRSLDVEGITDLAAPTFNIAPIRVQVEEVSLLASVLQVQRDLAEIGRVEYCGVSMRDLFSWTGIQVDTFVNFLSLPGHEQEGQDQVEGAQVRISHAELDPERKEELQKDLAAPSPFLHGNSGDKISSEWCLVSQLFPTISSSAPSPRKNEVQ